MDIPDMGSLHTVEQVRGTASLGYFISALMQRGLDLDNALSICNRGAVGELDFFGNQQWQDICHPNICKPGFKTKTD